MKKYGLMALIIISIMVFPQPNYAMADEISLESVSAVLIEASSGNILYELNKDERRAPASVTKLMTLTVALEAIKEGRGNLSDMVTTSAHAASLGGSQIYLEDGETMSLQDMLIAIAVGSANDACVAVAEHLYGSEADFVQKMNEKAAALGMNNTHFYNPYGLPNDEHYTSAYDLALLGREALKNSELMKLTGIKHYTLRGDTEKPFELYNTNKLLWWYPGADGFKTGWVGTESGYCLAATAQKNDLRLVAVVLGAQQKHGNFRDAMKLFNYGFDHYRYVSFYQADEKISAIPIQKSLLSEVLVGVESEVGLVLDRNHDGQLSSRINLPETLTAPIAQGSVLGQLEIIDQDEILASYELVALNEVKRCTFWEQCWRVCQAIFNC